MVFVRRVMYDTMSTKAGASGRFREDMHNNYNDSEYAHVGYARMNTFLLMYVLSTRALRTFAIEIRPT